MQRIQCELPLPLPENYDPATQTMTNMTDAWNADFFESLSKRAFRDLSLAANYLDIGYLLDHCLLFGALKLRSCKSIDEVCEYLACEPLAKDDKVRVRKANPWMFDE